jgi:uncharacterized protein (UPF0218 family)
LNDELKMPEKKRDKFSQPLGRLITGTRNQTIAIIETEIKKLREKKVKVNLYLVGDIVTQDFLNNTYLRNFIKLCIIDEKTQRNRIKVECEAFFDKIIEFENPKGVIKKESFQLLTKIVKSQDTTLLKIIDGEEDLLVLPLVFVIPLIEQTKNIVFYGQPPITDSRQPIPEGIVLVEVDKKIHKVVEKFLTIMQDS